MAAEFFELPASFFEQLHGRYGDPEKFVESFRARMREHRITAAMVSRRSGYHPPHISRWLGANRSVLPSMETMVVLDETLAKLIAEKARTK